MANAIYIKITGVDIVAGNMKKRASRLASMRGVNLAAVVEMNKWITTNFEREGGAHSNGALKWKKSKRAIREKGKTLSDRGFLKNHWTMRASKQQGSLKSDMNYSRQHEEGLNKLPRRKIFPEDPQAIQIVRPVYIKHVEGSIK